MIESKSGTNRPNDKHDATSIIKQFDRFNTFKLAIPE